MLPGIIKKSLWLLLCAIASLVVASLFIIFKVDPDVALAKIIVNIFRKPPEWLGHPMTQATIFTLGIAIFIFIDIWDKRAWRHWIYNGPPPDTKINDAIDYVANYSIADLADDPPEWPGLKMIRASDLIREKARAGKIKVYGHKQIDSVMPNFDQMQKEIDPEFWENNRFSNYALISDPEKNCQTSPIKESRNFTPGYSYLEVSMDVLRTIYPPKRYFHKIVEMIHVRR